MGVALDRAADALVARREADRELIVAAVEWAELHPAPAGGRFAGWGEPDLHGEGVVPLAGVGCAVGGGVRAVRAGPGAGVDHRRRTRADRRRARAGPPAATAVAAGPPTWWSRSTWPATSPATPATSAPRRWPTPTGWSPPTRPTSTGSAPRRLVHEARLWFDPDREIDDELTALATRKVELRPHTTTQGTDPLTTDVVMVLDTADAEAFNVDGHPGSRGAEAAR